MPIIDYGSVIYSPPKIAEINKIEHIQKYFTRRLFSLRNRPDYLKRLCSLRLLPLETRRIYFDLLFLFKILNNAITVPGVEFRKSYSSLKGINRRLFVNSCRGSIRKSFFTSRVVPIWNSLPQSVSSQSSYYSFKSALLNCNFASFLKGCAFNSVVRYSITLLASKYSSTF